MLEGERRHAWIERAEHRDEADLQHGELRRERQQRRLDIVTDEQEDDERERGEMIEP